MAKDFSSNLNYPIGLRNNNPGNLRASLIPWMGQQGSAGGFCKFVDLSYGLRALAVDLSNKMTKDGLTTIADIITKYAPPSENDTASYIGAVSSSTGYDPGETLSYNSVTLSSLMRAIIEHENGEGYAALISTADILQGITMMPQSIINRVKSFFVDNPALATASSVGLIAVILVIVFIVLKRKPNFVKKIL